MRDCWSTPPPALSPDGRRLAVTSEGQLWIHDLERRSRQRLALPGGAQAYGLSRWSADSTEVLFNLALGGSKHYSSKVDGSAPPRLVGEDSVAAISPDRQWLVFRAYGGRWIAPADGGSPRRPLVEQGWARRIDLCPDGEWLAYDFEYDRRTQPAGVAHVSCRRPPELDCLPEVECLAQPAHARVLTAPR